MIVFRAGLWHNTKNRKGVFDNRQDLEITSWIADDAIMEILDGFIACVV